MKGARNSVLHGQTVENDNFVIMAQTHGHVLDVHAHLIEGCEIHWNMAERSHWQFGTCLHGLTQMTRMNILLNLLKHVWKEKLLPHSEIGPHNTLMTRHNVIMIMIQNLGHIFLWYTQNHAGIIHYFAFPQQLEKQTIDKHKIACHDRKVLRLLSAVWIFPLLKILNDVFEIW